MDLATPVALARDRSSPPAPPSSRSAGPVGWPLSLGLQLVEIEALARIDRRRGRRWAVFAAVLGAVAVASAIASSVAGRAVAVAAAVPPAAGGAGASPVVLAAVAGVALLGSGAAGIAALRSLWSARQREADALTRQLRYGSERGSIP
jgi:hypothetical protein